MEESAHFVRPGTVSRLCDRLRIGKPTGTLQKVTGGLLHRMYRMDTREASFAVKLLNPEVMTRPGVLDNYRLSEKITRAALQAGLPSVPALCVDGEPVHLVDGLYFMVFKWVRGSVLPSTPANPEQCRIMGRMLARIHALKLDFPEVHAPLQTVHFAWSSLLDRGREFAAPWAYADSTLSDLLDWTSACEAAQDALAGHQVFSHGDLDQKNVLWSDAVSPCLIDWEAAGRRNPVQELVAIALDWGGLQAGSVDRSAFLAVIQGYLDAGGAVAVDWRAAINGGLVGQLQWLEYNMRRSLGEGVSEPDDQETGTRECIRALYSLRETARNRDKWCGWLEG